MIAAGGRVRAKLAIANPALSALSQRILRGPDPAHMYPLYMRRMHGISRAAVPLMEAALARAERMDQLEPVTEPLCLYLRAHIPEESGHADWILDDLEVLGFDPELTTAPPPPASVACLVGAQYYWIEHTHPVALLGYLAIMEGNPPPIGAVDELQRATGFPAAAFRSMRLHARLDVKHREDLYRAIDSLPLEEDHERLISMSALNTADGLAAVLADLIEEIEA
jgi:Iron-containing redox enzyme